MGRTTLAVLICSFAAFISFTVISAQVSETLEISNLGKVKGSFLSTRLGKSIFSFRGMRYAEPPVGSLRFQVRLIN